MLHPNCDQTYDRVGLSGVVIDVKRFRARIFQLKRRNELSFQNHWIKVNLKKLAGKTGLAWPFITRNTFFIGAD
jgi:hypothetical protein